MSELTVVYKDKNVVIIKKPVGMPSQSDPTGDKDAIMFGLKNVETTNRCTTLRQRIAGDREVIDIGGDKLLAEEEE